MSRLMMTVAWAGGHGRAPGRGPGEAERMSNYKTVAEWKWREQEWKASRITGSIRPPQSLK